MASKKMKRNLPIEIHSKILARLPVKPLLRFKSVSKSWYSLISDPYFIKQHRLCCPKNNNLFLVEHHPDFYVKNIVVTDKFSHELSVFERPFPYGYKVVDSCNGLVCIYGQRCTDKCNSEYISLWNPALRINKDICHRLSSMHWRDARFCFGFGFHNKYDDYRVIRFNVDLNAHTVKQVEIYSLSSNSWRDIKVEGAVASLKRLDSVEFGVYISDSALLPNFYGAYCWLVYAYKETDPFQTGTCMILSFDMGDEVFKEIELPSNVSEDAYFDDLNLFNCRNSLFVLEIFKSDMIDFRSSASCYVWMMKEYGEPKSWSKLYKFEPHPFFDVTFVGIALETELLLRTHYWVDDVNVSKDMNVVDIDKLQINASSTKDISIFSKATQVKSFTENLVLLEARKKFSTATCN